jgi:L-histidine Nalpha-methyltransferase
MESILVSIAEEVISGLSANPKHISSKFFYDDRGSEIFRKIMRMPEYYPTKCEAEIFEIHKSALTDYFCKECEHVDLVELGAGDGAKTRILLKYMIENNTNFRYVPVDISAESNKKLTISLREKLPYLTVIEKTGDYFEMIEELSREYKNRKIIMFLGSNLGNYNREQSIEFLKHMSGMMSQNDKLLIGLDLKKDPKVILNAYDDPHGHTENFNLNLLERFNRELGANFDKENFKHVPVYDPLTGAAKSYLVSVKNQTVLFKATGEEIHFEKWEPIYTEMSQKYDMHMMADFAERSGFIIEENFFDSRHYFVNSLWKKE